MCKKKCDGWFKCKEFAKKVVEESSKKIAELIIVGLILGVSLKMLLAIPAVLVGVTAAKAITTKLL
ncbi:hypothetical protein HOC01_03225 [archaeon]|jgi:hypothetical protein|nr:hypothetical protein [archaeon]MBT6698099.1 hypothetical protein [archaeon]